MQLDNLNNIDILSNPPPNSIEQYIEILHSHPIAVFLTRSIVSTQTKTSQPRNIVIAIILIAGSVICFIGSLTFLVGRQFPAQMADLVGLHWSITLSDFVGLFLAGDNIAIETLFYTWTIFESFWHLKPYIQKDNLLPQQNTNWVKKTAQTLKSVLLLVCEWLLAICSAVPLTFVSFLDQEQRNTLPIIKYPIVVCIALITAVSNKYFLSLTHQHFYSAICWVCKYGIKKMRFRSKFCSKHDEDILLKEITDGFVDSVKNSLENLTNVSNEKRKEIMSEFHKVLSEGENLSWLDLMVLLLNDLSVYPSHVTPTVVVVVPFVAIFAALSWIGVIATVPYGVKTILNASPFWQYTLMIVSGIPLLEIGLCMGGSFTLQLAKLKNGTVSLVETVTPWFARWVGYILLIFFGLGSFATNATLTIQEFKLWPWIAWLLLPSATLGIDLINITSGIKLWNDCLIAVTAQIGNRDDVQWVHFNQLARDFIVAIFSLSKIDMVLLILVLPKDLQIRLMETTDSAENIDLQEFKEILVEIIISEYPYSSWNDTWRDKDIKQLLYRLYLNPAIPDEPPSINCEEFM